MPHEHPTAMCHATWRHSGKHLQKSLCFVLYFSICSSPPRLSPSPISPSHGDPYGCLAWLDAHPARSVAYMSFGTVASSRPDELREMAQAFLSSSRATRRGCAGRGAAPLHLTVRILREAPAQWLSSSTTASVEACRSRTASASCSSAGRTTRSQEAQQLAGGMAEHLGVEVTVGRFVDGKASSEEQYEVTLLPSNTKTASSPRTSPWPSCKGLHVLNQVVKPRKAVVRVTIQRKREREIGEGERGGGSNWRR